jgi:hypothetical protein
MNGTPVMNARDSVHGSLAECYITINDRRYNFMQLTNFESHYAISIVDVPILGKINMGHKPAGASGTWTATAHFNQSVFREVLDVYQKTGVIPYFEIQVTNEDPTSTIGRQTVIHKNCLFDDLILSKFEVGNEVLDEDLSGTFDDFELPETFTELTGM